MTDRTYQGHKNRNHWNVALWINNDEGLYRLAQDCIRRAQSRATSSRARAVARDLITQGRHDDALLLLDRWQYPIFKSPEAAKASLLLARA